MMQKEDGIPGGQQGIGHDLSDTLVSCNVKPILITATGACPVPIPQADINLTLCRTRELGGVEFPSKTFRGRRHPIVVEGQGEVGEGTVHHAVVLTVPITAKSISRIPYFCSCEIFHVQRHFPVPVTKKEKGQRHRFTEKKSHSSPPYYSCLPASALGTQCTHGTPRV